jgi:hypothetical protein
MLVWFSMVTLIADAVQVVDMRLRQIATDNGTPEESGRKDRCSGGSSHHYAAGRRLQSGYRPLQENRIG